jgi:predicted nucleic-acid-binding Zn-ribbon protein
MNESGTKGCPKCNRVMISGNLSVKGGHRWEISWSLKPALSQLGEKVAVFRCRKCGYVELYSMEFPRGDKTP